jgi:serine/threonine-protein kinase
MSPEQVQGLEADARSDIFGFGAMLYEMATGKPAFEGKSQASIVGSILANDPPPITAAVPTMPAALSRLAATCLAKDADERFQTMHDARLRLMEMAEAPAESAPVVRGGRSLLPWAVAAAMITLAVAGFTYFRPSPVPADRM